MLATGMLVPKAAVNKNDNTIFRKDDIGGPRKIFHVQPIAKATGMKKFPSLHFWGSVLASDARHHPASGRRIDYVDHQIVFLFIRSGFRMSLTIASDRSRFIAPP
jgi:hypothetical protein